MIVKKLKESIKKEKERTKKAMEERERVEKEMNIMIEDKLGGMQG